MGRTLRHVKRRVDYNLAAGAGVPVHTAWDLGHRHSTAIWFFQVVGPEVRVIDFYENHGQYADHYCGVVSARGYRQGNDYVPHDARVHEWGTGKTRLETLIALGRKILSNASFLQLFSFHTTAFTSRIALQLNDSRLQGESANEQQPARQPRHGAPEHAQPRQSTTSHVRDALDSAVHRSRRFSFGWKSGSARSIANGFMIVEILLVSHGGNKNITIVPVEKKVATFTK